MNNWSKLEYGFLAMFTISAPLVESAIEGQKLFSTPEMIVLPIVGAALFIVSFIKDKKNGTL